MDLEKLKLYLFKRQAIKISKQLDLNVKRVQIWSNDVINLRYYDNNGYLNNYIIKEGKNYLPGIWKIKIFGKFGHRIFLSIVLYNMITTCVISLNFKCNPSTIIWTIVFIRIYTVNS